MWRTDILLEIFYNMKEPDKTIIRTNAKSEAVQEILETWLTAQVGGGQDFRKAVEKEEYKISINLDLSDDTFRTSSDTGNMGLTAGIVMNVLNNLDKLHIALL